jgi:serine protease Do
MEFTKLYRRRAIVGAVAVAIAGSAAFVRASETPGSVSTDDPVRPATVQPATTVAVDPTLGALSNAFAATAAKVKPSVVYITARQAQARRTQNLRGQQGPGMEIPPEFRRFFEMMPNGPEMDPRGEAPRGRASGSGFIVSQDGYILTNAHVVDGADKVTVRLLDRREFPAKVVGKDVNTDVAVLKIEAKGLVPAPLGTSDNARVGEWVLAVGNPLGENLTFTVTSGIISAKGRSLNLPGVSSGSIQDFIQTDAAINPGNSGGPLVNVAGEVIGINSAIASPTGTYAGYGFAIPIDLARAVMSQLISGGKVERAALGITVREATANDAAYVGLPEIRGVLVEDFGSNDSPAKAAGMQPGDVIVAVDGKPVDYVGQLQERIAFRKPGEMVSVEVARKGGKRETLKVKLQRASGLAADRDDGADDESDDAGPVSGTKVAPLGLTVAPVDGQAARALGLPAGVSGVVVTAVAEDGPSSGHLTTSDAGGPDVIVSVEGKQVSSAAELRDAVSGARSGEIVSLRVFNAQAKAFRMVRVRVEK